MNKLDWFFPLAGEVGQALNGHYMPTIQALMAEMEAQGGDLWVTQVALSEAPEPMNTAVWFERIPYMTQEAAEKQLSDCAENGFITAVSSTNYLLTDKGRDLATAVQPSASKVAATLSPIPAEEMTQLATLLRTVVDASVAADEPDAPCLKRSRFFEPSDSAPTLERARRALNDLAAFRDDVHVAAWREYDLAGHEWEAFSHASGEFVFGEAAPTGEELAKKLGGFRGYDADAYTAALKKAAARGWLVEENGRFAVTAEGKQLRQAVEDETNRLFYAPWTLSNEELTTLQALMKAVRDNLKPPEAKEIHTALDTAHQTLAGHFWSLLQAKAEEVGFDGWDLMLARRAAGYESGISLNYIMTQIPYMEPNRTTDMLEQAVERGFLQSIGDNYLATDAGREGITAVFNVANDSLTALTPLPADKLINLFNLLGKLSESMANADEPADKPVIIDSRQFAASEDHTILWQISRRMFDMAAFRDDAHVAAWQAKEVPGYEWEAFSHVWGENVWGDKVSTAAEVAEKLSFRGHDEAVYSAALQSCVERGWMAVDADGVYSVTDAGQTMRQGVEDATDGYFYAPFAALNVPERIELHGLLTDLGMALKPTE